MILRLHIINSVPRCYTRAMQNPPARTFHRIVMPLAGISLLCGAAFCQEPAPMNMSRDNDMVATGLPKDFDKPMPLYPKALGKFTRPTSSRDKEAQAYFDQGFQLMYAFGKMDAAKSFREAEKRDPNCAICLLGRSLGMGLLPEWTHAEIRGALGLDRRPESCETGSRTLHAG